MNFKVGREEVLICKHCGNNSPHIILYAQTTYTNFITYTEDVEVDERYPLDYYLVQCKSCDEWIIMYDDEFFGGKQPSSLSDLAIQFPKNSKLHEAVPTGIKQSYYEAKKVQTISKIAFAIMIRRALEQIAKDKDITPKSLKASVSELLKLGLIPQNLAEMAEGIRLLGNMGAHDDTIQLNQEDCILLDEFYLALIEYIYVAPAKIKRLQDSISKKIKKKVTQIK